MLTKNGKKMDNQSIQFTLFDSQNSSSWGIDKNGGSKFLYWEILEGEYAHFELNNASSFSESEIETIKELVKEGWLLTFRSHDEYQLYTSISILKPNDPLLQRQFDPIPEGTSIQYQRLK